MWFWKKDPRTLVARAQERLDAGDPERAQGDLEKALETLLRSSDMEDMAVAMTALRLLLDVHLRRNDLAMALARSTQAEKLARFILAEARTAKLAELEKFAAGNLIAVLMKVAALEVGTSSRASGIERLREALALSESTSGADSRQADGVRVSLGTALLDDGCSADALEVFEVAWAQITRRVLDRACDRTTAYSHFEVLSDIPKAIEAFGHDAGREDLVDEARRRHERIIALKKEKLGDDDPEVAISLGHLCYLLARAGRAGEAQAAHDRAIAVYERVGARSGMARNDPRLAATRKMLATMLEGTLAP